MERDFLVDASNRLGLGGEKELVKTTNTEISMVKQCTLLSINRSNFYYKEKEENPLNLRLMRLIDKQYLITPFYGSRQMTRHLQRQGYCVGRKRIRRLMKLMGI